jgi:glutaredoxin 3
MIRFFLYLALILVGLLMYNTFFVQSKNHEISAQKNKQLHAIIYTKSNCPYCFKAKSLLKKIKISYEEINLENDNELQQKLILNTNQRTVPYIYINNDFIGGFDDLNKLHKSGKF